MYLLEPFNSPVGACERCNNPAPDHRVGDVCVEPRKSGPGVLPWSLVTISLAASTDSVEKRLFQQ
jgi:hypothetical protein